MIVIKTSCSLNSLFFTLLCEQITAILSNQDIKVISSLDDQDHFQSTLTRLLEPRVVGSQGWKNVQNFIKTEMESLGMTVELDSFYDETPIFGKMNFVNIIGKVNPTADKFLTLACHYDSKYFKDQVFVGATDSSVPCSVMLNIVKTTMPLINKLTDGKNLGLMLLFFDGEEAFKEWSDTDSLYGSRHLAQKWETTSYKNGREIDRIQVLVLLDLIGATNARFVCTFPNTCSLNKRLREIENKLASSRALEFVPGGPAKMFLNNYKFTGVSDDHLPFLIRSVPVLHLIPERFPRSWHTLEDNEANIDMKATLNFNRVMRIFVIDYLNECIKSPSACQFNTV
ncbi:unnamed protein product [Diamesa serratosioi]